MPRRSRGSKSSSPQKSTTTPQQPQTSNAQQPQQTTDTDGWTTKRSRQKRHNIRKPAAQPTNPSKPNKKKLTRNQRRKRAKQQRLNQESNNIDEKQPEFESVINEMQRCWPRFKNDKHVLLMVAQQMKLKSFDPNNEKLRINVLERIGQIQMQQLMDTNDNNNDNNQYIKSTQNKQQEQEEDDDDDDEEEEDEEDEDEEDEEDEDEDDDDEEEEEEEEEEDEEEDQNDEESTEQKESSEAPPKSDVQSTVDDDKKSIESQHDEPQRERKRKRKRKRNRRKTQSQSSLIQQQIDDDDEDDEDQQDEQSQPDHDESMEITQKSSISRSPSQSTPQKKKRGQRKRKKLKLSDHLKNLDINDLSSTSQQLNEWITNLRSDNQQFLNAFIKANGIDIIVEKLVLNLRDISTSSQQQQQNNRLLSSQIITLFDILLSGTREYHEWLYNELIKLSSELKELSKNQSNDNNDSNNNSNDNLVDIITQQTRNLIRAQTKKLNNNNEIVIDRDNLSKPSGLLHGGHQDKDPIVGVVRNLDSECHQLSDLLYALRRHDSRIMLSCPTSSERFRIEYNQIKTNLSTSIQFISTKSQSLERELFSMKSKESDLQKQEEFKLAPLKSNLQQHQDEKYNLLTEKQRIEQELEQINQRLNKCDMFIQDTKHRINEIKQLFKPKTESLFTRMTNHQFGIAGYAQEQSIYSSLLQIVNDSYMALSSWSNNRLQTDNDQRSQLETNYINHLARYLNKICDANMMVINRVNQLKQHIESFKKTNEITNKYYGQQRNIDQHLKKYEKDIICDEQTNENIKNDCYNHIDRAANIVSQQLFKQFINHINNQPIAKIIDLSKYQQMIQTQQQQQHQSQPPRQQAQRQQAHQRQIPQRTHSPHSTQQQQQQSSISPRRQRMNNMNKATISRNTVSTQTQQPQQQMMNNGHGHHHQPQSNESGRRGIKPPMTKSSNIQNTNNTQQQQRAGLKPPRSHYQQQQQQQSQQQQQARRAPMRSGRQYQQY